MTNATKAALIAALNTVTGALFGAGIIGSSTEAKIAIIGNVVLGAAAIATRKLSPKWNAVAQTVATDVAQVAEVGATVAKTVAPKPKAPTKKAATPKKTTS